VAASSVTLNEGGHAYLEIAGGPELNFAHFMPRHRSHACHRRAVAHRSKQRA